MHNAHPIPITISNKHNESFPSAYGKVYVLQNHSILLPCKVIVTNYGEILFVTVFIVYKSWIRNDGILKMMISENCKGSSSMIDEHGMSHCYVLNPNKFGLIASHANICMYILFRTLALLQFQANGLWNWFFKILLTYQFQPIKKCFDCTLILNFIERKNEIKSVFVKFNICFDMSTTGVVV